MRRRRANAELFEEIRREYEFGEGTIQGVALKLGVHRRMVREALAMEVEEDALWELVPGRNLKGAYSPGTAIVSGPQTSLPSLRSTPSIGPGASM